MTGISVLLLTLNEEKNLPACLEALSWCDDIWLVDSFSNDRTIEIARNAGVNILKRRFDSFAEQRNFAIDNAPFRHEWILHLDADEICTTALYQEMQTQIQTEIFDAFQVPSKMMFMGQWLKFSGMYPTYQVRLGRHPKFRFKQVGHGQREDIDPSRVGTLKQPYLHYSFSKGLDEWFEKHNRYATQEALQILDQANSARLDLPGLFAISDSTRRRRILKQLSFRMSFRPTLRFLYMYLLRLGMLDGKAGYRYCRLLAIYESIIDMKVLDFSQRQTAAHSISHAVTAAYKTSGLTDRQSSSGNRKAA
ncbi:MAG: glycosyltransferase family 2 protein [Fuerstiella sp.]